MRAFDWRSGWGDTLACYGVRLVEDVLGEAQNATADPLRALFRRATLANFNPRGSHFDGFVARLYECAHPCDVVPAMPIATDARQPRMQLLPAIYAREQQRAIVQALYRSCEDYFVSAVKRFGERHRDDLLTPCWDKFRQLAGTFLMRFRDPASAGEREWIAIALASADSAAVTFAMLNNRLVPCVPLAT